MFFCINVIFQLPGEIKALLRRHSLEDVKAQIFPVVVNKLLLKEGPKRQSSASHDEDMYACKK